ncbi:MAG: protein-disulfide reductase DsbD domain-containing protein [Allomuricauda sp.]
MKVIKQILLCCGLLISMAATSQILEPASWNCSISNKAVKPGDIVELVFTVELDDTWHLYGNKQNYDIGPLPTVFEFEKSNDYKLIGDVKAVDTKMKYDDVFEVDVNYFEHTAEFRQKVKVLSKDAVIKGSYEYQVCTMVDGKCIMGNDDFEIAVNPSS